MTRIHAAAAVALLAAATACSTDQGVAAAPAGLGAQTAAAVSACPMDVPGTQVATADTPGGEAITFTTTVADRVSELRSRVRAMTDLRNDRLSHAGPRTAGFPGSPLAAGTAAGMPPPGASHAFVEDVGGGARVLVTIYDPMDLERYRSSIRMRAASLAQAGRCGGDWIP